MNNVKREDLEKILSFLYWEEKVYGSYLPVERIQYDTDLTCAQVQEGLRALGYSGLVTYVYHQKDIGIEEARITQKGKEKAERLNEKYMRV